MYAANSLISILFLVLVLAVSGIPPFLGFWPKLLLLQGFITDGDWLLVFSILFNSLLTLIAGTRLWSHTFWRPRANPHVPPQGLGGAVLLTGTVILLSLFPNLLLKAAGTAAGELLDPSTYISAVGLSP
jgi:multicomponent Na+:H+ antiporter subunit D